LFFFVVLFTTICAVNYAEPLTDWDEIYQNKVIREADEKNRHKMCTEKALNNVEPPTDWDEIFEKVIGGVLTREIDKKFPRRSRGSCMAKSARRKTARGDKAAKKIVDAYSGNSNRFPKIPDSLARKPFYQKRQIIKQIETDKQNSILMERFLQTTATVSSFR